MKLNFLFLPFIGFREPGARYLSHISPRFNRIFHPHDHCGDCLHSTTVQVVRHEDHITHYRKKLKHKTRTEEQGICKLGYRYQVLNYQIGTHPCKKFTAPFRLKKL